MQERNAISGKTNKFGEEGTTYDISGRCLIIRLQEELDHHNAIRIKDTADRLIDRNNIKHIIFDFSGAGFMDSAGIGVIMGRYRKVIFIGGKTAVANVNSAVDRIFRISGLYKIIEKYDTVEAALSIIKERG